MFDKHFQRNIQHDRIHQLTGRPNITNTHRDRSCEHCYPPDLILSNNFQNFWDWYSTEYPVRSYTFYTQQFLEELSYRENDEIWPAIIDLIFSIRYLYTPHTDLLVIQQAVWNAFCVTDEFQTNLDLPEYEEAVSDLPSGDDLSEDAYSFELPTSDSDEDLPDYLGLQNLFQQYINQQPGQPQAQQNMAQPNAQDFQNL